MPKKIVVEPGDVYGYYTLLSRVEGATKQTWLCRCKCGVVKQVRLEDLRSGRIKSCNCSKGQNQLKGELSPSWKGGRCIDGGYVFIYMPTHPNKKSNGYVREHTYVMSEYLGRSLIKGENVHHKNGDKIDNRIENLELWCRSQPSGQRVSDKIEWAKEILHVYGTDPAMYRS